MKRSNHRGSKCRGNSMVEMALFLPPALFVLMAGLDIGQFMMRQQGFVERVRAGCRYAVVEQYDPTKIRNVVMYGEPNPSNPSGKGFFGLKPQMVGVSLDDVGQEAAERVTIEIRNYPVFLFTPGLMGEYTARPVKQSITRESFGVT